MLWMLALAHANEDYAEMAQFTRELDEVDARIAAVDTWAGAELKPAEHIAQGEAHEKFLREAAGRAREMGRLMVAIKGRLEAGSKQDRKRVSEAKALQERIKSQSQPRYAAVNLVTAGLLTHRARTDPSVFGQLDNALFVVVTKRTDAPKGSVDLWLSRPIEVALQAEQWRAVHSWATYCEARCVDKTAARTALERLQDKKFKKDPRWLDAARAE